MPRHLLFIVLALAASALGAQTVEIAATVVNERGQRVADAVVVAVPADGNLRLPTRPRENVVDQVDKEFLPKVQAVLVGTSVTFPNNDNVRHHVYSFSPAKRFELPLYAGVPAQPVVFDKAGVVVLGCNIHDWMVGYIYVSESPYFAKTDKDGKAVLAELPPRSYVVRVWHPQQKAGEETTKKVVDTSGSRRTDVDWTLQLKPEARVRRAPTTEHSGHY
jgi:plastocyanin